MNYLKQEKGIVVCLHPQVEKVSAFGGNFAGDKKSHLTLSIFLKNGERKNFDVSESSKEAEAFLQKLPQ